MVRSVRALCALVSLVSCALAATASAQSPSPAPSSEAPPFPSPNPSPTAVPSEATPAPPPATLATPTAPPAPLSVDQIKTRERMALLSVSTVVMAQKTYATLNRSLYDSMTCLMQPGRCIPGLAADAAPVLDPGYQWLEPRLGYVMRFHPGPAAAPDEIRRNRASPSSIKSFAVTVVPQYPGRTGGRAFCGDSGGRMCYTDGAPPPVRDGRCEPCSKLQ